VVLRQLRQRELVVAPGAAEVPAGLQRVEPLRADLRLMVNRRRLARQAAVARAAAAVGLQGLQRRSIK